MGVRQKVEILKALYRGVNILILDEPTTNLIPQEVDALFETLKIMVKEGLSIVFITHKLREVLHICDRISVLREGKNVVSLTRKDASDEMLVRAMVGEGMDLQKSVIFSESSKKVVTTKREPVLQLENVSLVNSDKINVLSDISLEVGAGEILGIAGVAGNGQRDLAEVVMGIQAPTSGTIKFLNEDITHTSTKETISRGFVYIPEDRLADGFLHKASVAYNLILGYHNLPPYSSKGIVNWKNVNSASREMIKKSPSKPLARRCRRQPSGGNIQRVMIARAFSQSSNLWSHIIPLAVLTSPQWTLFTRTFSNTLKRAWAPCSSLRTWMNCCSFPTESLLCTGVRSWASFQEKSSTNTRSAA
jgi:simple sugar transport system ATP-binding protein